MTVLFSTHQCELHIVKCILCVCQRASNFTLRYNMSNVMAHSLQCFDLLLNCRGKLVVILRYTRVHDVWKNLLVHNRSFVSLCNEIINSLFRLDILSTVKITKHACSKYQNI